jgi:S-adenosylmethionine hydrolase
MTGGQVRRPTGDLIESAVRGRDLTPPRPSSTISAAMELKQPIITLTTDFGTADGYVGAMKGVLLSICPSAQLIDITHSIPPQDVYRAAFTLLNAASFFPPETVHLVVVDPGVGTTRRPLALRAGGMTYVGPDNGVFTLALRARPVDMAVALQNPAYHLHAGAISDTFHGRDLFAPAAAHLAAGVPLAELGPQVADWVTLPFPTPNLRLPHKLVGEVLYLDHFGNAITNLGVLKWKGDGLEMTPILNPDQVYSWSPGGEIACRGGVVRLARTYGDVPTGTPVGVIGSSGFLEIAVRDGSAGASLGLQPGDAVVWSGG